MYLFKRIAYGTYCILTHFLLTAEGGIIVLCEELKLGEGKSLLKQLVVSNLSHSHITLFHFFQSLDCR